MLVLKLHEGVTNEYSDERKYPDKIDLIRSDNIKKCTKLDHEEAKTRHKYVTILGRSTARSNNPFHQQLDSVKLPNMVSRKHARIEGIFEDACDIEEWRVIDLKTTNGILVNGTRVRKANLKYGDVLTLGGAESELVYTLLRLPSQDTQQTTSPSNEFLSLSETHLEETRSTENVEREKQVSIDLPIAESLSFSFQPPSPKNKVKRAKKRGKKRSHQHNKIPVSDKKQRNRNKNDHRDIGDDSEGDHHINNAKESNTLCSPQPLPRTRTSPNLANPSSSLSMMSPTISPHPSSSYTSSSSSSLSHAPASSLLALSFADADPSNIMEESPGTSAPRQSPPKIGPIKHHQRRLRSQSSPQTLFNRPPRSLNKASSLINGTQDIQAHPIKRLRDHSSTSSSSALSSTPSSHPSTSVLQDRPLCPKFETCKIRTRAHCIQYVHASDYSARSCKYGIVQCNIRSSVHFAQYGHPNAGSLPIGVLPNNNGEEEDEKESWRKNTKTDTNDNSNRRPNSTRSSSRKNDGLSVQEDDSLLCDSLLDLSALIDNYQNIEGNLDIGLNTRNDYRYENDESWQSNYNKQTSKKASSSIINNHQSFHDVYKLGKLLGRGAFGRVKHCTRKADGKGFAVKILKTWRLSKSRLEEIRNEVMVMSKIQHEHCIQLEQVFETDREISIVMELADGGELIERLSPKLMQPLASSATEAPSVYAFDSFCEEKVALTMKTILETLKHLHSIGIVHRDLKPNNILYTCNGVLKICDFGMSHLSSNSNIFRSRVRTDTTLMTRVCGTPGFAAPEVLAHEKYTSACDIWSAGIILYILLCGFPPFYDAASEKGNRCRSGKENLDNSTHFGVDADDEKPIQKRTPGNHNRRKVLDRKKRLSHVLSLILSQQPLSFPSPYWDHISSNAKDLCKGLLTINPTKRLTCEEALAHPWILTGINSSAASESLVPVKNSSVSLRLSPTHVPSPSSSPSSLPSSLNSQQMLARNLLLFQAKASIRRAVSILINMNRLKHAILDWQPASSSASSSSVKLNSRKMEEDSSHDVMIIDEDDYDDSANQTKQLRNKKTDDVDLVTSRQGIRIGRQLKPLRRSPRFNR